MKEPRFKVGDRVTVIDPYPGSDPRYTKWCGIDGLVVGYSKSKTSSRYKVKDLGTDKVMTITAAYLAPTKYVGKDVEVICVSRPPDFGERSIVPMTHLRPAAHGRFYGPGARFYVMADSSPEKLYEEADSLTKERLGGDLIFLPDRHYQERWNKLYGSRFTEVVPRDNISFGEGLTRRTISTKLLRALLEGIDKKLPGPTREQADAATRRLLASEHADRIMKKEFPELNPGYEVGKGIREIIIDSFESGED